MARPVTVSFLEALLLHHLQFSDDIEKTTATDLGKTPTNPDSS